jgi:hypothetical protein
MINLYAGKVKFAAGQTPLQTQYGPRINAVVTLEQTGEDIKLWGNPGSAIAHLRKGETISVAQNEKGQWQLASLPAAPAQPQAAPNDPPTATTQPQTAPSNAPTTQPQTTLDEDVRQWIRLYTQVKENLPEAGETTWRSAASTLFINRVKSIEIIKNS